MELEISNDGGRSRRRTGPWMEVTLITGFIFSLVVGLVAVAALYVSLRGDEVSLTTPASLTINAEQIVPQLALAYQAAAAGEIDTASAIALSTTELSGPQRLSLLLRLGERYLSAERPEDAVVHFNLARAIAVLDPAVDGIERSAALALVADGFLSAEDTSVFQSGTATRIEDAALDGAIQSMRSAEQTPGLLPTHRSQVYEDLRPVATALDDRSFAQELAELARNPYFEPPGVLVPSTLPALRKDPLSTGGADAEIAAAVARREQSARQLADRIPLTQGLDIAPETQSLAAALVQEDQLREAFYRRALNEGLSLGDQYTLLLDRRDWIALKLRAAQLGFGLSLAPEWEQTQESLRQELSATTANLNLVAEAMANELAEPAEQALLRAESLLWLAQQAELDFYPGASMDDLHGRLQGVQRELSRLGTPLALPVAYEEDAAPSGFRIQATR